MHRKGWAALLLVATATRLLLGADAAQAGGGTWTFEDQGLNREAIFTPGARVRAYSSLSLKGVVSRARYEKGAYWGGPEHGPYYGYISGPALPGRRPMAPPIPNGAIRVGEVLFSETRTSDVLDVSLEFVMPDLEPGYYTLHHCNAPCTRQIGDIMSTPITVVEDRGQALLAGRVQRLESRDLSFRFRVEDRINDVVLENAGLESDIATLQNKVEELEARPAPASRQQQPPRWTQLAWGIAGAVVALLAVLAFGNIGPRLRRKAVPHLR